ncbi:MltR family transcriptional regulator [Herbaspirillum sp. ST 5-3]|uniref:MltR family transcriptional regulator n=1 Tax=Oxalobacteraceae TaxID=75682 RepID=UPI0010A50C30|nr:MltR family transcriptional regulator [Herbaspirillum sp. ST 5-3]
MARRPPIPPEELSTDSTHLYEVLNSGPDTSAIVVGVSYIDACLASLLSKRLLKSSVSEKLLDSRSGAIGSFAARTDLAYTLGLIPKAMYKDLLVLAELRNETAHHHFELSFASEQIKGHCGKLDYAQSLTTLGGAQIIDSAWLERPRDRFTITAVMILNRILLIALGTEHVAGAG